MGAVSKLIPDRLKALRLARGLSQEALGHEIGVTRNAIVNWEGKYPSSQRSMHESLARALDTTTDYLLGLTDDPGESGRTPPRELVRDGRAEESRRPAWAEELMAASLEAGRIAAAAIKCQEDHFVAAVEEQRLEYNAKLDALSAAQQAQAEAQKAQAAAIQSLAEAINRLAGHVLQSDVADGELAPPGQRSSDLPQSPRRAPIERPAASYRERARAEDERKRSHGPIGPAAAEPGA